MRLSFGGLSLVLQPPNLLYGVRTGCLICKGEHYGSQIWLGNMNIEKGNMGAEIMIMTCSLGETVGMVRDVHDAVRWVSPRSTPRSSLGAVVRWVSPLGYSQDICKEYM